MADKKRLLLSGNEAVAYAALDANTNLGTGYPGTPSTEVLETLSDLGGVAQWAPNEKVALEVAIGVAFANGRALATMKHVGLNVAADPLFTVTHTGVTGALVILVADDPGMASSQNEQDSRRYAVAAGAPMLEPADSQEAYTYYLKAVEISHRWNTPVLLRLTTRTSHSKSIVERIDRPLEAASTFFEHRRRERVMVPANARPAHRRLHQRLKDIAQWSETDGPHCILGDDTALGIVTAGIGAVHSREAAPNARVLKLGLTHPLPFKAIRKFADSVERCMVIEEGDPVLLDACRAAGVPVVGQHEMYRFGELNVARVRRIVEGDTREEAVPDNGRPPQLCPECPHRVAFDILNRHACIVAGDIGCYALGVLPPYEAMDTCVCMGAAIGVGLGLRHVLPAQQAKRVVSVIGDSTFVHSGLTGLVEMIYNPPPTGHVVLILDNDTTAMTGMQEHPGTGRRLNREPTGRVIFEDVARALGMERVLVVDPREGAALEQALTECMASGALCVIIARSPCILTAKHNRKGTAHAT